MPNPDQNDVQNNVQNHVQNIDTIIRASWIVPVEPDDKVYENCAIAIDAGKILEILPTDDVDTKYNATHNHDLQDHILIPGFINAHTHSPMNLMRGLADDLHLMDWLTGHIWPAEEKWVSARFVRDGSELAIAEMLRSGTTCFNDMYFFPNETGRVARETGIRASVSLIVIDFPSAWAGSAEEYLHKGLEVYDMFKDDTLVSTVFGPHAPYTVSDKPLKNIAMYADELDLQIQIHLHETAHEINEAIEKTGKRPLARINELDLLSPRLQAVHMTQLNDEEIALIADNNAHIIHCPESNMKLASGFCPVSKLIDANINVAIGTDGAASNNDLDMISEMRIAALLAKAGANDASAVPAMTALKMATINGAKAMAIDNVTGSLLPGKAADITAINLGDTETQPVYHPVSQLVYSAGRDKVTNVWVAGKHLLKDKILTTIDEQAVLSNARQWRDKIHNGRK